MRRKMKIVKTFMIAALIMFGLSGVVSTANAIIGGQLDGNGHPYVGVVMDSSGRVLCSGVAVSPDRFVTAAHCSSEFSFVWIAIQSDLLSGSLSVAPGFFYPHPDFEIGGGPGLPGFDTHDVAVVWLPIPTWNLQTLGLNDYALLPDEYEVDTLPMRTEVTIVGYGFHNFTTGNGAPQPVIDLKRYSATSELITSQHSWSSEYIKLSANPAQDKGGVCFGDSGGPNLIEDDVVIGINSYVNNDYCAGVTYSNRIDLPDILDFINYGFFGP